jgi:TrmH family RNA methyltransferase
MITSPRNQKLKDIRRLRRSKGDLALLEGPHLIAEALRGGVVLEEVLATPEFLADAAQRELLAALPHPPEPVAAAVLDRLADADSPRGIVAVARLPRAGAESLPVRADGVYVYADALQDPGNLGALARVAEAASATGLALGPGCCHPNHPRALRAAAGSLLRLPVGVGVDAEALASRLRPIEARWTALLPRGGRDLHHLAAAEVEPPLVLLVGAEGAGLSPDLAARATQSWTIPVAAPVESLNATVAAAIALFEIRRRARG